MELNMKTIPTLTLDEFADKYGLTMTVNERTKEFMDRNKLKRYYASFDNIEVKKGIILSSSSGNADTVEEAISRYVDSISGLPLVHKAFRTSRVDIEPTYIRYTP